MGQNDVTCSHGFPAALRHVADGGPPLVLTRLRFRIDVDQLILEAPMHEEATRHDERIALHDFEAGPWPQTLAQGQTLVRVTEAGSDPSRSLDVPAGIFPALYSALGRALQPGDQIAIADGSRTEGFRVVRFGPQRPKVDDGDQVTPLHAVAFDVDPEQGTAFATFAARVEARPEARLQVSLEQPIGDEVTADVPDEPAQPRPRRSFATSAMAAQAAPGQATPFRPSTPPPQGPPQPSGVVEALPPPPVASAPLMQSGLPPSAPLPVRGPDAARPLLDASAPPVRMRPSNHRPAPALEPAMPRIALELLWHDPDRLDEMKTSPNLVGAPRVERLDGRRRVRNKRKSDEVKPEKVVTELLRYSSPVTASSLRTALGESLRADEQEASKLLMVEGELYLSFDPRTELETLVSLARPLAKGGGALADALDHVDTLLSTPIEGAPDVARRMADRIRRSWKEANRSLPDDYLSGATERVLLTERAYQKVRLFGGSFLRGEVAVDGAERGERMVVYLPESIDVRLPLFPKLPVRMIATAHLQQDVVEKNPMALRCIAIARRSDRV